MSEQLDGLIRQMTEIISHAYDMGYKDGKESVQCDKRKEPTEIKVGDIVRTLKDKDEDGYEVFPIGTIGTVINIIENAAQPYQVSANNNWWLYSRDMLEVVDDEIKDGD